MKLYWVLKQKGYPVEEIYDGLCNTQSKPVITQSPDDFSDNEPICSEPPKNRPKPVQVPSLNMIKVEPNSFTDERKSDSDEEISF